MSVLRFIFRKRFNHFEAAGLVIAVTLRATNAIGFWGMAGLLFAFAIASVCGEALLERRTAA